MLDQRGTTAIEYALITSVFAMVLVAALGPLRGGLSDLWQFADSVDGAIGGE
jgi:Flp pilus assembly pilin Flp